MNNSWDEERRNYRGGQNRPDLDRRPQDVRSRDDAERSRPISSSRRPVRRAASSHFSAPTTPESKNMDPVWVGNDVVDFISDRDGVANVWSYDTKSKKLAQLTSFSDFDVKALDAASDGSAVVFEQAGQHPSARSQDRQRARREHHRRGRLPVDDAAVEGRQREHDATWRSRRPASASRSKRAARSSRFRPSRATFAISRTRARRAEHEPAWSPDGKSLSYFSDRSGEYALYIEAAGRLDAAARDQDSDDGPLLHGRVVARRQADHVPRHEPQAVGRGRRDGTGEGRWAAIRGWCRRAR